MKNNILRNAGVAFVASMLLLVASVTSAQTSGRDEIQFRVVSMKGVHFDKPLNTMGKSALQSQQLSDSFMIKVEVSASQYDSGPASIEPRLYIGDKELRTYSVERLPGGNKLLVTYYYPGQIDASAFETGAPMVITKDQGRPIRERGHYRSRSDLPRFRKDMATR